MIREFARRPISTVVLLVALLLPQVARGDYEQVTLTDFADILSGPGEDFQVIQDGSEGDSFPVLQKKKGWVKVRLTSGVGWITEEKVEFSTVEGEDLPGGEAEAGEGGEGEAAAKEEEQEQPAGEERIEAIVKTRTAKLFAEATTKSTVVTKVKKGVRIEVIHRSDDSKWYKVRHDGPQAWVRASSVRLAGYEEGQEPEVPTLAELEARRAALAKPAAPDPLGPALRAWAGVGEARLNQQWDTNASGTYPFPTYRPPYDYDLGTPGPAFLGGVGYWFNRYVGAEASGRLVWAHKGLEINDPDYTNETTRLTMASYLIDGSAMGRFPFLDNGAYVSGRIGYRFFKLSWDQAQPDPAAIAGGTSPLFWSVVYHGPLVGLGVHFPFADWIGVDLDLKGLPFAFAANDLEGGTADTPSGNLDGAWGMGGELGLYFVVYQGPPSLTVEVRGFFDYAKSNYVVPAGAEVPRASSPYLPYTTGVSTEQSLGGSATMSVRF